MRVCVLLCVLYFISCSEPRILIKEDIDELETVLKNDPNSIIARYNVGIAQVAEKNYDIALEYFYECIRRNPQFAPAHFAIYCVEYKKDKNLYKESLKNEPQKKYKVRIDSIQNHLKMAFLNDPFIDWKLATILLESRTFVADIYTRELLEVIYSFYYDGFEEFFLGKYDQAIKTLTRTINIMSGYHQARYFRGLAYGQVNNYDASIDDFTVLIDSLDAYNKKKILPIYLKTSDLHYLVGHAHLKNGNLDQAQAAFQKILVQDMSFYMAHFQLARIYQMKRKIKRSIQEIDAAIFSNPNNSLLHYNKAVYLTISGNIPKSIHSYRRSLELNPYNYKAYFNLGILYEKQQEYKKALESFNSFLELSPKSETITIQKAKDKITQLDSVGKVQ